MPLSLSRADLIRTQQLHRRPLGRLDRPQLRCSGPVERQPHCRGRRQRRQRRERGRGRGPCGVAFVASGNGAHARPGPEALARADPATPGRPGAHHLARTGKAARRSTRRGPLCRLLRRVVRRGGDAQLRRRDSGVGARPQDARDQGRRGRGGRDHTLELSGGHDRAQDRTRTGGGLHRRRQACRGHPPDVVGAGTAGRGGRSTRWRAERGHRVAQQGRRSGRRVAGRRPRAQDHLHRIDTRRQAPGSRVFADPEAVVARTRRQCAVHRVRRCRRRRRGRRPDGGQVPQWRADLRLAQPRLRAGRRARRVRREARGARRGASGRPAHRTRARRSGR